MSRNRRKKNDNDRASNSGGGSRDAWLLTYSDVITLLLAFFAVLIAVSHVDLTLFDQLKQGLRSEITRDSRVRTPLAEIKKDLDSLLVDEKQQGVVDLSMGRQGIKVFFYSSYFYESGGDEMLPKGEQIVQKVQRAIKKLSFYEFNIDVEGHTDDVPINTPEFPSNWDLSTARASNVVQSFINAGIEADRLKASGFADTEPLVANRDSLGNPIPENRARNRRIVIRIYY